MAASSCGAAEVSRHNWTHPRPHSTPKSVTVSQSAFHISVTGNSHICELMHHGGILKVTGTPGENEISIGCTTLALSGNAEMEIHNVRMGRQIRLPDEICRHMEESEMESGKCAGKRGY